MAGITISLGVVNVGARTLELEAMAGISMSVPTGSSGLIGLSTSKK
mgnify:CR=1 FL=1